MQAFIKTLYTDQDGIWSEPLLETLQLSGPKTRVIGTYMDKAHKATVLSHEALLLFSKNYNFQNAMKLPGPWADGAYRLT